MMTGEGGAGVGGSPGKLGVGDVEIIVAAPPERGPLECAGRFVEIGDVTGEPGSVVGTAVAGRVTGGGRSGASVLGRVTTSELRFLTAKI